MAILKEYQIRQADGTEPKNPVVGFDIDGEFIHISRLDTTGFSDPQNAKIKVVAIGKNNGEIVIETTLKEKQSVRLPPGTDEVNKYIHLSFQANEEVPLDCDFQAGFGIFSDTADPASVDVSEDVNIARVGGAEVVGGVPITNLNNGFRIFPIEISNEDAFTGTPVPLLVNSSSSEPLFVKSLPSDPVFIRTPQFYPLAITDETKVKRSEQYGLGASGNFHKPTAFSLFTRPWVNRPKGPGTVNLSAPAMALKLQRPALAKNINTANFRRLVITKMSVAWEVGIATPGQIGIPARQEDFAIYKTTSTPDRIIAGTINTSLPGIQSGFRSVGNPIPDGGFSTGPKTAGIYTDDPAVEVVLSNDAEPTPHPGNKIYISTRFFEAEAAAVTPISPNGDTAFTVIQKLGNSEYTLWNESGGQYSIHKAIWEPKIPVVLLPGEGIFFGPNEIMPVTNANFYSRGRFFEIHGYVVTDALQSF